MKLNFTVLLNAVKSIVNPQQAIDKMLNNMPPEVANMLRAGLQRNADPMQILSDAVNNGDINLEHFNQMKSWFMLAKKFGVKQFRNIDASQFDVIEKTIRNASSRSRVKNNGGFKRL